MSKEKLEEILKQVADRENFKNYEVCLNVDALRGDGFLSESYTGEVVNKDNKSKIIHVFIKTALSYMGQFTSWAYCNEYHFYANIVPELAKFQTEKATENQFENIPKFYCGKDDEYVALENLNIQNYIMSEKSQNLNADQLDIIFKTYGKFHALTFAYKGKNLNKYQELIKPLKDLFIGTDVQHMLGATKRIFNAAYNILKATDVIAAKKIENIVDNFDEIYASVVTYNGKYSALTQGDCWSNNMLFKYGENGKIENMRVIDFQLCRDSTPIHDLSYFFYSGAAKEDFKKLDEYLELYYSSFSAFATSLGCDPNELLPLNVLKSEWKKYGLMGIFMGILLWPTKLINKNDVAEFTKSQGGDSKAFGLALQNEAFKKNTADILLHAIEYGII